MPAMNDGILFYGVTPHDLRKFLYTALVKLRARGYRQFVDPCAGSFAIAQVAAAAGFKPEEILTGDILVFSDALANCYNGTPFDELPYVIEHPYWDEIIAATGKAGYGELFVLMKAIQVRPEHHYQKVYLDEIVKNAPRYVEQIEASLSKQTERLRGIRFVAQDMAKTIRDNADDPKTVFFINVPILRGDYEKMFGPGDIVGFKNPPPYTPFDIKKQYDDWLFGSVDKKALFFWGRMNEIGPQHLPFLVFLSEKKVGQSVNGVLCTRPDEVPDELKNVKMLKAENLKPLPVEVYNGQEILPESKVQVYFPKKENALYYRNLWMHKLNASEADLYAMFFVDGRLICSSGFLVRDVIMMKSDHIFEMFAPNPPQDRYRNLQRLILMFITSGEFRRHILTRSYLNKAHLARLNKVRTVYLTNFRKGSGHDGIFDMIGREPLPGTTLKKIIYEGPFRDDTFQDCVKRWLNESRQGERATQAAV